MNGAAGKLAVLGIGLLAVIFGVYFTFAADRLAGKNLLSGKGIKKVEDLINRVYALDEKLVQMKVAVAVLLFIVGIFMVGTAVSLRH